jgi:hypothetical protein
MLPANPQQGRRPTLYSTVPARTLGKKFGVPSERTKKKGS